MSKLAHQIEVLSRRETKDSTASLKEATISAQGNATDRYTIELRNGARASNVPGPSGYSIGDSVTVASYPPGRSPRFVIIARSYQGTGEIETVIV